MRKLLLLLNIVPFIFSCHGQDKIDLSKLNLNEPIENVIDLSDKKLIGIETVEYPFCLMIEVENSQKYNFEGIDLSGQRILFQIHSEKLKTDSITKNGGGHIDLEPFKNISELNGILKKYNAENNIYGLRITLDSKELKANILKKLESKYGKGTKNPNTENGLYWNLKKENRYLFFAPDYDRLIILNSSNLSKTCYWDSNNGFIDFGGCDRDTYMQELTKNTTKPENIKNKPVLNIDNDWGIHNLFVGKSNEADFVKSDLNKIFERMTTIDAEGNLKELMYQDQDHEFYFYFNIDAKNTVKGYSIMDFKLVNISFDNGLKPGINMQNVIQLFDKSQIANYADLKFSNYIEIKNGSYIVTLLFDKDNLFSGMYVK